LRRGSTGRGSSSRREYGRDALPRTAAPNARPGGPHQEMGDGCGDHPVGNICLNEAGESDLPVVDEIGRLVSEQAGGLENEGRLSCLRRQADSGQSR
jgi:hypothetical protein